jgi:hypothetical protein
MCAAGPVSDAMITSIGVVETIRCDGSTPHEAVRDAEVVIAATGEPLTGFVLWPSVHCVRGEVSIPTITSKRTSSVVDARWRGTNGRQPITPHTFGGLTSIFRRRSKTGQFRR